MQTLLMLGDSLVEWGDWGELLSEYQVLNRGRAGETLEELSVRLGAEMETAGTPDHIFLMSGTNNLLMGDRLFPALLRTLLPRLRLLAPEAGITVNGLFPMARPELDPEAVTEANRELAVTAGQAGCDFLDPVPGFALHCRPITNPCFLPDGVHLSGHGYRVWASLIREQLTDDGSNGS